MLSRKAKITSDNFFKSQVSYIFCVRARTLRLVSCAAIKTKIFFIKNVIELQTKLPIGLFVSWDAVNHISLRNKELVQKTLRARGAVDVEQKEEGDARFEI